MNQNPGVLMISYSRVIVTLLGSVNYVALWKDLFGIVLSDPYCSLFSEVKFQSLQEGLVALSS